MNSDGPSSVHRLAWDTDHFGIPIARVSDDADIADAHEFCVEAGMGMVYYLTSAERIDRMQQAADRGYRMVDLRVSFSMPAQRWRAPVSTSGLTIRSCVEADLPALESIARVSHRNTRFRADGRLDPELCDELYAAWVRNAFHNGDPMWTALAGDRPVGYLMGTDAGPESTGGDREGRVSLVAVDPRTRGSGAGRALVATANDAFISAGCTVLAVGTQGINAAASNLYESLGYRMVSIHVWHHWHALARRT